MLKEILENISIELKPQDFKTVLAKDFTASIIENCGVDLDKIYAPLNSLQIEKIVENTYNIYQKIFASSILSQENKILASNVIMGKIFERWINSDVAELFFIKIQAKFTPAQLASAIFDYATEWKKYKWLINFFVTHKQIFPHSNKKIRTIGIYYTRIFNGGVEKFLSLIIPIYIKLGYRVILFTDVLNLELEFSLPPQSEFFERVNFSTSRTETLRRLNEFSRLLEKYSVDLLISHMRAMDFSPFVQFLFCKLSGIKIAMELHGSIKHEDFQFPKALSYKISDAVIVLSKTRMEFLRNLGVRTYYIPNPIILDNAEFGGRESEKISNTILWVGRISSDKNFSAVVPIMKEVVAKIPTAKLKILGAAGNSITLKKFLESIKNNNLESNIKLCGFHTDIKKFYETADVMLNTSPHEGWSLSIAESKFYELPLVLYELPDNELTSDGKGYISVAQGDYHAAAQAIIKILTNSEFRRKLSIQARESLQPFLNYDIDGAWQKVFGDLENNLPQFLHNLNNEQIQNILLEEIFKLQQKVKNLKSKT